MALKKGLWSMYHIGIRMGYGTWPQFYVAFCLKGWLLPLVQGDSRRRAAKWGYYRSLIHPVYDIKLKLFPDRPSNQKTVSRLF